MRTTLAVLSVLAAPVLSLFAADPYYPINADFERSDSQWHVKVKQGNTITVRAYTYQGTNVWNPSGWTAYFKYGKDASATAMVSVAGTCNTNGWIDFHFATNDLSSPVDSWYSTVYIQSNNQYISQADGMLTIQRAPELSSSAFSMSSVINGSGYSFLGSFSNWPFLGRSDTNASTTMLTNLNMGGYSITNIGNSSLKFADGTSISSAMWQLTTNQIAAVTSNRNDISALSSTSGTHTASIAGLSSTQSTAIASITGLSSTQSTAIASITGLSTTQSTAVASITGLSTTQSTAVASITGLSSTQSTAVASITGLSSTQSLTVAKANYASNGVDTLNSLTNSFNNMTTKTNWSGSVIDGNVNGVLITNVNAAKVGGYTADQLAAGQLTYYVWGSIAGPFTNPASKIAQISSPAGMGVWTSTVPNCTNLMLIGYASINTNEIPRTLKNGLLQIQLSCERSGNSTTRYFQPVCRVYEADQTTLVSEYLGASNYIFPDTKTRVPLEISITNETSITDAGRLILVYFKLISGWAGSETIKAYSQDGELTYIQLPGSVDAGVFQTVSAFNTYTNTARNMALMTNFANAVVDGNVNANSKAITNLNYLYATNYIQIGNVTDVYSTVGSIRIGESAASGRGIYFGDDAYIYRSGSGTITLPSLNANTWFFSPLIAGSISGDTTFGICPSHSNKFRWGICGAGTLPTSYWMAMTNSAGTIKFGTGESSAVSTNALEIGAGTNLMTLGQGGPLSFGSHALSFTVSNATPVVDLVKAAAANRANVRFFQGATAQWNVGTPIAANGWDGSEFVVSEESPASAGTVSELTLKPNGYLGLGTNVPQANLHVSGSTIINSNLTVLGTVIANDATGTNYASTGALRLGGSTSTNDGIWFGKDTGLYRTGAGNLQVMGNSIYATYHSGYYSQGTYFTTYGATADLLMATRAGKKFVVLDHSATTNLMTVTNNAGIGQLEVGNINITNSLKLLSAAQYWEDLVVTIAGLNKITGASHVAIDNTECSITFDTSCTTNTSSDQVYATVQFPHAWKTNSQVVPHIHWIQANADQTNCWFARYRWYNIGDPAPSTWSLANYATNEVAYSSGSTNQLSKWYLDGTGKRISSILEFRILRDGSFGTGTLELKSFDVHYQKDGFGSDAESSKSF